MSKRLTWSCAALLAGLVCGASCVTPASRNQVDDTGDDTEETGSGGSTSGTTDAGSGGDTTGTPEGGNGGTTGVVTSCGLPVPRAAGIAKPSGAVGGMKVLD